LGFGGRDILRTTASVSTKFYGRGLTQKNGRGRVRKKSLCKKRRAYKGLTGIPQQDVNRVTEAEGTFGRRFKKGLESSVTGLSWLKMPGCIGSAIKRAGNKSLEERRGTPVDSSQARESPRGDRESSEFWSKERAQEECRTTILYSKRRTKVWG